MEYLCTMQLRVMAILNVTPDSFYADSRLSSKEEVIQKARQFVAEGASVLDIGACSTRPNSTPVSAEEEWRRLEPALTAVRQTFPEVQLSVDTFRPEIAQKAIRLAGPLIVNDISGDIDSMLPVVRAEHVPYVWTLRGDYSLLGRMDEMKDIDLILDPGLGFCGGVEQDYACLRRLDTLHKFGKPVLVGCSRKSMLYKPLGLTPSDCLPATQVLHLYALQHGATLLRVHDVKEAMQTVALYQRLTDHTK